MTNTTNGNTDTVLINGKIATSAVAIQDGRFTATGNEQEILTYQGMNTQVIDLGGRTVIPGLIDSHIHVIRGGLHYTMELRWDGVPSLADARPASRRRETYGRVSCKL